MDESQTSNLHFIRRDQTSPPAPNLNTAFHHRRREIRNLGFNSRPFKFSHRSRGLWVNPRKFVLQNLSSSGYFCMSSLAKDAPSGGKYNFRFLSRKPGLKLAHENSYCRHEGRQGSQKRQKGR